MLLIICDDRSHIVLYEMGGPASLANCLTRTISTEDGLLDWDMVSARVRGPSDHFQGTGLISVEDSHNVAGGRVYPRQTVAEICEKAHAHSIPVHMDGARIFNAAAYLGITPAEVAAPADSVMFCLSKGFLRRSMTYHKSSIKRRNSDSFRDDQHHGTLALIYDVRNILSHGIAVWSRNLAGQVALDQWKGIIDFQGIVHVLWQCARFFENVYRPQCHSHNTDDLTL